MTNPQRVQSVVDEVVAKWGGVDVLVNNACLALFIPFEQCSLDDIRREFEVNYFGYLNMIRAVLPVMKRQRRSVIHNLSSGVGFTGMPNMTGYTSTKGAIESLDAHAGIGICFAGNRLQCHAPAADAHEILRGVGSPARDDGQPRGRRKRAGKTRRAKKSVLAAGLSTTSSFG